MPKFHYHGIELFLDLGLFVRICMHLWQGLFLLKAKPARAVRYHGHGF
jgi:hypothetical protein